MQKHFSNRRKFILSWATCALFFSLGMLLTGCVRDATPPGEPDAVWGERGITSGKFQKPRAMVIDASDRIYIVDKTARVQVFDLEGKFLRQWQTPDFKDGKPTGLSIARDGSLLIADTHYFRVLRYNADGMLQQEKTLGGTYGEAPGEFGLVTDAVEDSLGNMYVAEYGDHDRIQKFSPEGKFLLEWGTHGSEPGQFLRPQNMVIDAEDRIWVADACNHRIQVFNSNGKLLFHWGKQGEQPGELHYPYDLALDGKGHLYVCEYGNHRIQKFTLDGKSLGCWGKSGRKKGEFFNPWALALDKQNRIYILDSNNHRVQRIHF